MRGLEHVHFDAHLRREPKDQPKGAAPPAQKVKCFPRRPGRPGRCPQPRTARPSVYNLLMSACALSPVQTHSVTACSHDLLSLTSQVEKLSHLLLKRFQYQLFHVAAICGYTYVRAQPTLVSRGTHLQLRTCTCGCIGCADTHVSVGEYLSTLTIAIYLPYLLSNYLEGGGRN
jgi:hypothetical protein